MFYQKVYDYFYYPDLTDYQKFYFAFGRYDVFKMLKRYTVLDDSLSHYVSDFIDNFFSDKEKEFYLNNFNVFKFFSDYRYNFEKLVEFFEKFLNDIVANKEVTSVLFGGSSINDAFSLLTTPDLVREIIRKNVVRDFSVSFSYLKSVFGFDSYNFDDFDLTRGYRDFSKLFDKSYLVLDKEYFDYNFINGNFLFFTQSRSGKFDLYIDSSSSMSSFITLDGVSVSKLVYAVALGLYIFSKDVIEDLYFFSSSLRKVDKSFVVDYLLRVSPAGGTSLYPVFENVRATSKYSVIVTDGSVSLPDISVDPSLVFFIFVGYKPNFFKYNYLTV